MNRTERDIIQSLWGLLREKPYNKITVQEIVDRCGVNRNTFYYHFQDIPSLMEYSIQLWTDSIIEANALPQTTSELAELLFQNCMKVKPILLNIYRSAQREYLQKSLFNVADHLASRYIEIIGRGYTIPQKDKAAMADFCRCTLAGASLEWMESGMSANTLAQAKAVFELLNGMGKQVLLKNATPEADG